ncbi:hypothetical protein, partial [Paenibacillus naphthalenovorans]|uniref:hypothetical protein n=1 Tax=Paenibacillus naphthalenovorans TaxID=162209 RepID=UPI003D2AA765
MSYIKYLPKPLLEDIINNNCIPIIGAGFSLNAELPKGKTMPKWDDLGEAFAKELGGYAYNHRVCQEF